jgi:hypothetical protein
MVIRRVLAVTLAATLALSVSPAMAQQAAGILSGNATDEANKPYTDYSVQLRDAATGVLVGTVPLDAQGHFSFANVEMTKRFLVELHNVKENRVVCTEGPYSLTSQRATRTDVNIDCGGTPAALWLLLAGAGTVGAVAFATQSASQ